MRRFFTVGLILALACGVAMAYGPGTARERGPHTPGMGPGGRGPGGPGGPGGLPFAEHLYPAELVLRNQTAIGLTAEQISAIKQLLNETHSRTLELKVDLERVTEQLGDALEPARVDEGAALALADQAMVYEGQIKRAHLTMLIRLKNLLTPEQQAKLDQLKPKRPPVGPPPE